MDDVALASYFGVSPEIVEFVPDLLQDLWELGSDPDLIVSWLAEEAIGPGAKVLDLGCGKGAVAITIAETLGCSVHGIDALPAFIENAQSEARRRGLGELCHFEVGDLRDTVHQARGYDVVLLVSVGVLGSASEMVAGCRQCTAPDGLMIIDDCFLRAPGQLALPGYGQLTTHGETLVQLASHGDELIKERIVPLEEVREQNHRYTSWIERRAAELEARHPEHATAFRAYLEMERRECEVLEKDVRCASWMLRRAAVDQAP